MGRQVRATSICRLSVTALKLWSSPRRADRRESQDYGYPAPCVLTSASIPLTGAGPSRARDALSPPAAGYAETPSLEVSNGETGPEG